MDGRSSTLRGHSHDLLPVSDERGHDPTHSSEAALPLSLLTIGLGLSLWVAVGCLAHAVSELGDQPARRLTVGVVVMSVATALFLGRRGLAHVLRAHSWIVVPIGIAQIMLAAVDGLVDGVYVAWTLTVIGLAAVAAPPWLVWTCVAVLDTAYVAGVLVQDDAGVLTDGGQIGAILAYPIAAAVLMAMVGRFARFVIHVGPMLEEVRSSAPPARQARPGVLPAGTPALTAAELRVVAELANGLAPKEIAFFQGVSVHTVRNHIANAKRKTGARTLAELAVWPGRADAA